MYFVPCQCTPMLVSESKLKLPRQILRHVLTHPRHPIQHQLQNFSLAASTTPSSSNANSSTVGDSAETALNVGSCLPLSFSSHQRDPLQRLYKQTRIRLYCYHHFPKSTELRL